MRRRPGSQMLPAANKKIGGDENSEIHDPKGKVLHLIPVSVADRIKYLHA
jgi:hypothetical protein